jgi:hypothetical protein
MTWNHAKILGVDCEIVDRSDRAIAGVYEDYDRRRKIVPAKLTKTFERIVEGSAGGGVVAESILNKQDVEALGAAGLIVRQNGVVAAQKLRRLGDAQPKHAPSFGGSQHPRTPAAPIQDWPRRR